MGVVVKGADKLPPHLFVEEMQSVDIELGEWCERGLGEAGRSKHPMHEKKLKRGTSEITFIDHVRDKVKGVAEKGLK